MKHILNYTTTIEVDKTISEIQRILVSIGAISVTVDYIDASPIAISFLVHVNSRMVSFRLTTSWMGVYMIMKEDKSLPNKFRTPDQARRIAWRITKDLVEVQAAAVKIQQVELAEVFLPYAITRSGRTLFQDVKAGAYQLGSGENDEN